MTRNTTKLNRTDTCFPYTARCRSTWLAPVQAVVMNITDAQADWVREVRKTLANQGFRVSGDLRNEKIGYKIREHTLQRVPYLLVVGEREKENGAENGRAHVRTPVTNAHLICRILLETTKRTP